MYETMVWLTESDRPAARSWAELEIIGASVFGDLLTRGYVNEQGEPRKLLNDWRLLKQTQLAYERELGMTPAARAAMRVDALTGDDLAARASKLRSGVSDDNP